MMHQVTFFDLHTPILEGVTIRIYKIPCIYDLSSLHTGFIDCNKVINHKMFNDL